jgi:glycosyltransferase involved in cell wall biosynthesis
MKRFLIVTSTFPRNNSDAVTARFVFDLAKSLSEFYSVYVLCPHAAGLPLYEEWDGLKVYRFRYFFPQGCQFLSSGSGMLSDLKNNIFAFFQIPFFLVAQFFAVGKIIRKEKIDIVNSHWIIPQGFILAISKVFLKFTHVLTVHAADIFALKRCRFIGSQLVRFILKRTDLVLPVSNFIKEQILEVSRNSKIKSSIIPMGVNETFFKSSAKVRAKDDCGLKMLFVGKMVEKKGLRYLLEALNVLKSENLSFYLEVIGGGPLEAELKSYVQELGLGGKVNLLGWIANEKLPRYLATNDIVVVPSIFDKKGETEGMPVVILEAMAMARPVLASRISGIPDIVCDGYNGWLVEPKSSLELANKIREISRLDLEMFGANALRTAKEFTCRKTALNYKKVIDEYIEAKDD